MHPRSVFATIVVVAIALTVIVENNVDFPGPSTARSTASSAFTTRTQDGTLQSSTPASPVPHGMWAALQPRFEELAQLDRDILRDSKLNAYGKRTGFVIFAGAKGEHATVEEWVLYHMFIGVDKVGLVTTRKFSPFLFKVSSLQ